MVGSEVWQIEDEFTENLGEINRNLGEFNSNLLRLFRVDGGLLNLCKMLHVFLILILYEFVTGPHLSKFHVLNS
jgi:hypothetical protein